MGVFDLCVLRDETYAPRVNRVLFALLLNSCSLPSVSSPKGGNMSQVNLVINHEQIASLCRRHHIRRLAFFGSVLRKDFRPESDIDILVDFEPGHTPGFALIRIQDELSCLLGGKPVDLVTPKFLNHRIRTQVLAEAEEIYVER